VSLADPTTELAGAADSSASDANASTGGPQSGTDAGAAAGAPAGAGAADAAAAKKVRKPRTVKTAEQVILEAEEANKKAKKEADDRLEKAIAKAKRDAVPLGKRKSNAFDFVEKLRGQIRNIDGKKLLDDDAVDAEITSVINTAFPVAPVAPAEPASA